ncbi:hypothetical protein D1871_11040 [Nakamurella silvestris]|nr:hypothetical protein D1871_11040 [Nakamurella silvestris]
MSESIQAGAHWRYPYDPSHRQIEAGAADVDELLYGGAAGGGKSEMLLAAAVNFCLLIPGAKVILFRRTFPEIEQEIEPRLLARIPTTVGKYNSTKHVWTFRNGSRFVLGALEADKDVYRYLGGEYQLILWDEMTLFRKKQYLMMKGRLRAAGKVRQEMEKWGLRPTMKGATNPGGPGHGWVKERFIDPVARSTAFPVVDEENRPTGETGMFVQSLPADNPHLDIVDYNKKLAGMDPVMRRAYRDGDWDILDGVRFSQWRRNIHVIGHNQIELPIVGYPRAVGVDYGSSAPFAAVWGVLLPDNLVVIHRELYRTDLTPRQQAELIRDSEAEGERLPPGRSIPIALDPACWARAANNMTKPLDKDAPPPGSIAWYYREVFGSQVKKARNDRLAGWSLVDEHLRVRADGLPRLLVMDSCPNLIRTLPSLPRAKTNPEDVDTKAEDHIPDALRYLLMELVGPTSQRLPSQSEHTVRRREPATIVGF